MKFMDLFGKAFKGLLKDKSGNIAVMTALTLPVIIGFGALAYEVGYWYQSQQRLQQIADIGAFGGAYELTTRGDSDLNSRVDYLASENRFEPGVDGTLDINNPPTSGDYTADENAVEVIASRDLARSFTKFFSSDAVTINARAVATLRGGPACIYALSKTASNAFSVNGTTNVNLSECGIAVNSNSSTAFSGVGTANINAKFVNVAGGDSTTSNVIVNTDSGNINTNVPPSPNPLSKVTVQSYGACTQTKKLNINKSETLNPGVYCGGISIGGGGTTVTLSPGTYYIEGKSLSVTGSASLIGDNVTIVLSGKNTGDYATLDIAGTGQIRINAPKSGDYSHIAIMQDPNAPSGGTNKLTGGSNQEVSGIIYFPNQNITYSGNSSPSSPCVLIAADTVTLNGNANMRCELGDLGDYVQPATLALVE